MESEILIKVKASKEWITLKIVQLIIKNKIIFLPSKY